MKKIVRKIINLLGFDLVRYQNPLDRNLALNEELGYEFEAEASKVLPIIKNNTMLSKKRLVTLYQQVAYCEANKIPGAFVECGVWKGGSVGMMALANLKSSTTRRHIHLFDAFTEICQPDSDVDGTKAMSEVKGYISDSESNKGELKPMSGFYDNLGGPGTLTENQNLLEKTIGYPKEFLHYHKGWFQETLAKDHEKIGPIAILRLDGDWYASTKVCLEYLFDKVVPGGVIIIDDYGTYEGCKKAVDEFIENRKICAYLGPIDRDCRFFIKC